MPLKGGHALPPDLHGAISPNRHHQPPRPTNAVPLRGNVADRTGRQQGLSMPEDGHTPIAATANGVFVHPLRRGKGTYLNICQRMRMVGKNADPYSTKALLKHFRPPKIRCKG